jgi:hypothetical protein
VKALWALLLLFAPLTYAAPVWVKPLTATPASGSGIVSVKLDWQTTGAVSCTASGLWSGSKAVSGTETVSATQSGTYTLKCFSATTPVYTASLTWTPPTSNSDGSALTNLARYRVLYGKSQSAMTTSALIEGAGTSSATVVADSSGTWFFKVRAVTTGGVESVDSSIVSKALTGTTPVAESVTSDAPVTITILPNPPTGLMVTEVTAYKMRQSVDGFSFVAVGTVPLGTACNDLDASGMHVIPRASVKLSSRFDTMPLVVFAKCG